MIKNLNCFTGSLYLIVRDATTSIIMQDYDIFIAAGLTHRIKIHTASLSVLQSRSEL
jgi:hypothetical protein